MPKQKIDTLKWFIERIKETPGAHLWLASSGSIITGIPITATEYYQTIFRDPQVQASGEIEDVLALMSVEIKQGATVHAFNVALIDLSLIVAWGVYDPATTYSVGPDHTPSL